MKLLRPLIILFALLLGSTMAEAQPTPLNGQGLVYNSFTPYSGTNVITLSLSAATSGNAALGITSPVNTPSVAWVQNTGSNPANVILGVGNTLTASLTTGTYLGAGTCMALNSIGATFIAGYSTLGTTLTVTMGVGNPAGSCGGAGGGGSGGTSSSFGAAFPATGTAVGMSQGGNMVALTGTAGNLNVQCANCTGSGVSATDATAFTAGASLFAPGGGFFQTTATNNPLTTGQQGAFQVTANRALFTNLRNAAGTEVGTAGAPLQVSVANTGANGTAMLVTGTSGTFPITAASGAFASGSISAGAVSAGAYVSGSVLSGAFASGSLASGAMVDLVAAETPVAPNTATATKGLLVSGTFTTTQPTLTTTQQAALAFTARNAVIVAPGVDNFAVQATLQASATTAIGKVDPNTIATWGLAAASQNVAAPTNGILPLCQFTTSPASISTTNVSPLQCDSANNVLVNIKTGTVAATESGTWSNRITDGTNTAAVKAASTAPLATDPALVVSISPNSVNANGQATMANSAPVVLASNQSVGDPCMFQVKSNVAIATSGATNVQAVAGVSAKKVYVCSIVLVGAAAHYNVIEGTGAACTTANEAAVIGSTTAANGMSLAANGGFTLGNGEGTIAFTGTAANGICVLTDASVQFAGNITFVQQ